MFGPKDPKSSVGLSEHFRIPRKPSVCAILQPTPVRGRSLDDAAATGAGVVARDGHDCLPTRRLGGTGLEITISGGTNWDIGEKTKRSRCLSF